MTLHDYVTQTFACHPDWNAEFHVSWIESETDFSPLSGADKILVELWLQDLQDGTPAVLSSGVRLDFRPAHRQ